MRLPDDTTVNLTAHLYRVITNVVKISTAHSNIRSRKLHSSNFVLHRCYHHKKPSHNNWDKIKEETSNILYLEHVRVVLKLGTVIKLNRNTRKVLECGAVEGWGRSVGPIV